MSRAACSGLILLFRRSYTVAAAAASVESTAVVKNVIDPNNMGKVAKGVKKEVFWMRDSKTGNWLPETHFDEVDVAELRAKFLQKKQ